MGLLPRPIALLVLASTAVLDLASGQRVSFGFVGGTHLTRDFPISRSAYQDFDFGPATFDLYSDTHSFIAGFAADIHLSRRLSLEANALHRSLQLKGRFIFSGGSVRQEFQRPLNTWEWPLLLKYRLPPLARFRPFVAAGPSFRTRHRQSPAEPSQVGATVGAGIELQPRRLRISPAIRYTRWKYDSATPVATKRDQIEVVTGVTYETSVPSWKVGGKKLWFGVIGGAPFDSRPKLDL